MIPDPVVRNEKLSPGAKLAYGRLARFAGQNGRAWPSIQSLGRELGISAKQARRYVRELEDDGFIKPVREVGKSSSYTFLWHSTFVPVLPTMGGDPLPDPGDPPLPDLGDKESQLEESHFEESQKFKSDCSFASQKAAKQKETPALPIRTPSKTEHERLKTLIEQYMEAALPEGSTVVGEILRVTTSAEAIEILSSRYQHPKYRPGGKNGPRKWGWFLKVVSAEMTQRRAQQAARSRPPVEHAPNSCRHGKPDGKCSQCNQRAVDDYMSGPLELEPEDPPIDGRRRTA